MAAPVGPLPARLYIDCNQALRAAKRKLPKSWHRVLRVIVRGFWLGLLSGPQLSWLDERFWAGDSLGFDRYRDGMYRDEDFNLRGLFDWERQAFDRHFQTASRILVSSAGGGREVFALRASGCAVDAFECSPELVRAANDLLVGQGMVGDVRAAKRNECPDMGRTYGGLIVGWGSYGLIHGRDRRVAFLCRLRDHLEEGAPILLSFFVRAEGERRFRITAAIANLVRRLRCRERIEQGDLLEPVFFHFFTEAELRSELRAGGFELAHFHRDGYAHAVAFAV